MVALQTIEVEVGGMHCSACSGAVEAALTTVPGVQSASVSLVMRRATVIADPTAVSSVRLHDLVASYVPTLQLQHVKLVGLLHQPSIVRAGLPCCAVCTLLTLSNH